MTIMYCCKLTSLAVLEGEDFLPNPAFSFSDWLVQEDYPIFPYALGLHCSVGSEDCQLPVNEFWVKIKP